MGKLIMIVDDEQATRSLLKEFLELKGYKILCAADGLEALETLKTVQIDLLLLDVMMPRLDGYSLVRELKKSETLRTIPIIVLTAREMMRDLFKQEGVSKFIVKPFEPEELLKIILSCL